MDKDKQQEQQINMFDILYPERKVRPELEEHKKKGKSK